MIEHIANDEYYIGQYIVRRDFIESHSGRRIHLPDPDPESIWIGDIAHALSHVARFTGHTDEFYSVAEHSLNVAEIVPPEDRLQALLHDATEAYLCDVATPFKSLIPAYKALEDNLWSAIARKYGVPEKLTDAVKQADRVMLMTERDALKSNYGRWNDEYESTPRLLDWEPSGMAPRYIKNEFINMFYEYGGHDAD